MNTIEEKFQRHKHNLNQMKAPAQLEDRLRQALHRLPDKKRKRSRAFTWTVSAAAALILIITTYQYPALAYYGGKLLSGRDLTSLNFTEVAEHGYGQTINKSKTLKDGTVITIDGVIADDNAFLMYYTIDLPEEQTFTPGEFINYDVYRIKGFLTDSDRIEGGGNYSEDWKQFHGMQKFKPVSPFARTLTAQFGERLDNGQQALYPISFKFDANKAMKSIIKEDISKSVPVDEGTVVYDSITASPTATVIRGHYEMNNGEHPYFPGTTKLIVNGSEVESFGYRSDGLGTKDKPTFEYNYDVLPTSHIETMAIVMESSTGYEKVKEPIPLTAPSDRSVKINNEKLWIRSVTKTETGYDIVVARKEFTILNTENLAVQAGGKRVPVTSITSSRPWDLGNGNILREQTYSVQTTDKPEYLLLDGFKFLKKYNKTISIPVTEK